MNSEVKWIINRLPEFNGNYLVTVCWPDGTISSTSSQFNKANKPAWEIHLVENAVVIAWAHFPEAYKAQGENGFFT